MCYDITERGNVTSTVGQPLEILSLKSHSERPRTKACTPLITDSVRDPPLLMAAAWVAAWVTAWVAAWVAAAVDAADQAAMEVALAVVVEVAWPHILVLRWGGGARRGDGGRVRQG